MRLMLEFRDKSRPDATKTLAIGEAFIPYTSNTFALTDIPMRNICDRLEFRLIGRKLPIDVLRKSALSRAQDQHKFDYGLDPRRTMLLTYLDYMVDNLAKDHAIKPDDVQVVATTYPLNGTFTGAVHRVEVQVVSDIGPTKPVQNWVIDDTEPYGQQPLTAKTYALTA